MYALRQIGQFCFNLTPMSTMYRWRSSELHSCCGFARYLSALWSELVRDTHVKRYSATTNVEMRQSERPILLLVALTYGPQCGDNAFDVHSILAGRHIISRCELRTLR